MRNKKVITVFALLAILITMLTGCGKKVVCDFCDEEKKCETKTLFGEEVNICKDCLNEIEDFMN